MPCQSASPAKHMSSAFDTCRLNRNHSRQPIQTDGLCTSPNGIMPIEGISSGRSAIEPYLSGTKFAIGDDSQSRLRTSDIALAISDGLIPAFLARLRACLSIPPNSSSRRTASVFRIDTPLSPITTNLSLGFNPSLLRIPSGITTCPFEDIFVVSSVGMIDLLNFNILPVRLCSLWSSAS